MNARGLDLRLRLPEGLEGLETALRAAIKERFQRGNIAISLRLHRDDAASGMQLDVDQLDRVLSALDQVQEQAFAKGVTLGQPTAADVLAQRGVVVQAGAEQDAQARVEAMKADIAPLFDDFARMRAGEGAALNKVLLGQIDDIAALVDKAAKVVGSRKADMAQRLRDAMAKVLADIAEVDEARLAQELALIAVKQDVTEELDRLRGHVAAARDLLDARQPVGRKLDFLSQEFNREANTLCSKSQHSDLTQIGLDLKATIDQMREQVQNVE